MQHRALYGLGIGLVAILLSVPATGRAQLTAGNPALKMCDNAVAGALKGCFASVSARMRKCYLNTNQACLPGDAPIAAALARLESRVLAKCPTNGIVQVLEFGPLFTPGSLVDRLQEACVGNAQQLAVRIFGGPQAALLQGPVGADPGRRRCLEMTHKQTRALLKKSLAQQSACVRKQHMGGACNTSTLATSLATAETLAEAKVYQHCSAELLIVEDLTGLDENRHTAAVLEQSRCMVAALHPDSGPLTLDCGPRASVPVPPRGVWTQVVLSGGAYGTRCGDGSDYAFWIRLAPVGQPVERAIVNLQGGGVCIFDTFPPACSTVPASLFEAMNDYQPSGPSGGWLSADSLINPFSEYTMVALPYCTQDVFIGGGTTNAHPSVTVHRFGAPNTRATMRYLRDVLWAELDATTVEGYRPDVLRVLFGGESAGGFGVAYNYHYLLDDLRWVHTTAVPDSGLGLDNGGTGVRTLGSIVFNPSDPTLFWNPRPYQPPYCLGYDCAVIPEASVFTAQRLKAVPDQQILVVSNQVDDTQRDTTNFANTPAWTNAARAAYCATQGLNGLHFFAPADPTSIHTMLDITPRFTGLTADSIVLRDWLSDAVADPDGVVDAVEEGTLVTAHPGVNPFPCTVD